MVLCARMRQNRKVTSWITFTARLVRCQVTCDRRLMPWYNAIRVAYFAGKVQPVYRTTKAFSLPKERLPTQSRSNLIYLYECRNCAQRYVGMTSQRLSDRINQHVPKHLTEPGKPLRGRPPKIRNNPGQYQSAIACHLASNKSCCERCSVCDFSVLSHARTQHHLNVLEVMYIYN